MQRPLNLHVSALSDEEYPLFTSSFADIVNDGSLPSKISYDKQAVSIREARAWLRGRYADIPVSDVDEVCSLRVRRCIFDQVQWSTGSATILPRDEQRGNTYWKSILCSSPYRLAHAARCKVGSKLDF
jgi:hypothetical protein